MKRFSVVKRFVDSGFSQPYFLLEIEGPVKVHDHWWDSESGKLSAQETCDFYNKLLEAGASGTEERFEPLLLTDTTRYGKVDRPHLSWALKGPVRVAMIYAEAHKPDNSCKILNTILDHGRASAEL